MTDDQGSDAEPEAKAEQGQEAAVEESTTEETEVETEAEEAEAVAEEEVEVEVDYKAESEKLKQDVETKQKFIKRQRAALAQQNKQREELQAQLNAIQSAQVESKEPSIDDFDTHDEYVDAVADFRADQRVKQAHEKLLKEQQQTLADNQAREQQQIFMKQEQEYRAVNPKYDESKAELQAHMQTINANNATMDAIYEQASREGGLPEVVDFFGEDGGVNLNEFDRISALSPTEAAVEVYKIQQKLKTVTPEKTKPLPKPIKDIKGKSKGKKDISQMTGKELLERMKA
jgi:hypothetical protein